MDTRLIETAFPLKQTSLDSVHEKNVRHGHISTLHIWPARRPLAAARAALIATLLPDPGTAEERKKLLEKLGGKVVQKKEGDQVKEETVGGILHWGRESGPDLAWFREEIRKAYGGRAPRVLDPFSGGGAIPLEAMRLGCEVTAIDINPVAWFILKCTLEYPQRLADQKRPLPEFALQSQEFLTSFFKAQGYTKIAIDALLTKFSTSGSLYKEMPGAEIAPDADLAWHVRAWGWWVLQRAKADLEHFYPTIDGKPTVAYLWARTVTCKHCRATLPLLKTRWLCKKANKRVLLTMTPNTDKTGVVFGVLNLSQEDSDGTPKKAANKDQGKGTMSRTGAACPCCQGIMTMEDIRLEGQAGRLGAVMTAVVISKNKTADDENGKEKAAKSENGKEGKEYRSPTAEEIERAAEAPTELPRLFADIPFGLPEEPLPSKEALGFRVPLYGFNQWYKLFTPRQLLALGTFVKHTRAARMAMAEAGYPAEWIEAVEAYLACILSRTADYMGILCVWEHGAEEVKHIFMRWALPITWDFAEANPLAPIERFYLGGINSASRVLSSIQLDSLVDTKTPHVINKSAIIGSDEEIDVIVTDPPYYDAIPYAVM